MDRRRKTRAERNRRRQTNVGVILVTVVVVCFAFVMTYEMQTMRELDNSYAVQVASLNEQLASEQQRTEDLEESKAYVQTNEYIEQMAREKLGLVNPDETVVKARQ